jgi:hypothetical protein
MGIVPEKSEGLPLYDIEQGGVGQSFDNSYRGDRRLSLQGKTNAAKESDLND